MKLISITAPLVTEASLKFPSTSVMVPVPVPCITTLAPIIGSPCSSVTFPLIFHVCA